MHLIDIRMHINKKKYTDKVFFGRRALLENQGKQIKKEKVPSGFFYSEGQRST